MRKTIIFFFLILFFSNNAYSSSCESEFQTKPVGEGIKVLFSALKMIAESAGEIGGAARATKEQREIAASVLTDLLEMDIPLELEVQVAIAESAGKIGKAGATEEAKEAAASVLKALLEMDIPLELEVQVAIAESAGKLGKAGAGVLKEMLEKYPQPYVQVVIVRSAGKIGAEARELEARQAGAAERQEAEEAREEAVSILKDLSKRKGLGMFIEGAIAKSAGEIGGEEGAGMLKALLEKDPIFVVRMDIIRSAKRIEEETGIKLEGI